MGLDKSEGDVYLNNSKISNKTPQEAIKNKFAMVPEDRKDQGLVLMLSILNNIEMSSLDKLSNYGFMNRKLERSYAKEYIDKLRIKTAGYQYPASSLSGGNQQKVIIAKCLANNQKS